MDQMNPQLESREQPYYYPPTPAPRQPITIPGQSLIVLFLAMILANIIGMVILHIALKMLGSL
jgi:hypothetical protein